MRVLLTGASGFLGAKVVASLRSAGHDVREAERRPSSNATIACDFNRDTSPEVWKPRLAEIDAVVNCVGILRETNGATFQRVHVDAPLALFRACVETGVRRVIQLSALGEPEDGEFIASKHRGDAALAQLDLDWLVLRPGLVYSTWGAYGGTSLLRAAASLPGLLLLPGRGDQPIRPLAAEDLGAAVINGLNAGAPTRTIVQLVGRDVLTLRAYLLAWRRWFGLSSPMVATTPRWALAVMAAVGERWGRGPVCRAIVNLLQRRRIGTDAAIEQTRALLGREPVSLNEALQTRRGCTTDLLEARWYWVRPLLLMILGALWIASGVVGLLLPAEAMQAQLPLWSPAMVHGAGLAFSVADIVLGLSLWFSRGAQVVLALMLTMVATYTLVIGLFAPWHWLDPFGGLWKNAVVVAALVALLVLPGGRR